MQRYGGTIDHFGDDGFLAFFGIPVAHEDHTQRAVLAALSLQQCWRQHGADIEPRLRQRVAVRMGVHTGHVMVGHVGDDRRLIAMAVGDTTYLADRLLYLAEPDTILLSNAASQLVQGYVRVEALEPVRGLDQTGPILACKVLGVEPQTHPWHGSRTLSPFVGRKRELATLHALLAQVEDGRGQAVGVVGEPGMGKSRLLHEFRLSATKRQLTYWTGQCRSYGHATPYLPLLDLLRRIGEITDVDDPKTVTAKAQGGLQGIGMESETWVPYLLQLLGVQAGIEELATLNPQARKARTFDALLQVSLNTSQQHLLVLENLHWIDPTSEEWLVSLVERLVGVPILLLVSYRPGYRPPWIDKSYATQIALQRLTTRDSLQVVQAVLRTARIPGVLVRAILDKADGNPFFLEELTLVVRERGDHQGPLAIPDTIQGVLAARIDRKSPEGKHLLQVAAVIGKEIPETLPDTSARMQHELVLQTTLGQALIAIKG